VTICVERFFRPINVHLRGHWLPLPSLCRSQSYAIQCPRVNLFSSASTRGRPPEELYWICYFRHYTVNLGIFLRLSWLLSALTPSSQRALKSPIAFFKGGNITQLGGDFILGPGELASMPTLLQGSLTYFAGNHCSFASRMRWATDRTSVLILGTTSVPGVTLFYRIHRR